MDIRFDPVADAAYIRVRKGQVTRTEDLGNGYSLDYGRTGKVLGIEILFVSKKQKKTEHVEVKVPDRIWKLAQ